MVNRTPFAPKQILITRLSAIGDCVLTLPMAVEAKRLWPESRIVWLVDCAAQSLLEPHPCIDEVLRIEKRWLKKPQNWSHLRSELRSRQFDLVLDPQGLSKSALLGWISGSKSRIGFDYSHGREIAPLLASRRIHRTQRHMVDTYRELLSPFTSIAAGAGEFQMPIYDAAAESIESALEGLGLHRLNDGSSGNPRPWFSINPGAGWTTRQWPVERFGRVARHAMEQHGLSSVVVWAGESERLMAQVIAEESRGAAQVAPATDLPELVELIRRSEFLLTGDTGPLHLASAVGTPCVSLHGPTWADESGPYGNRHVAIQSPLPNLSKKFVRRGPNVAMQAIEVEEVEMAIDRLLRRIASSATAAA